MVTVFLDRDGVINENRADYVKSWDEVMFLPGSIEAMARLTRAGHRVIVCTNQAGVARGHMSVDVVEDIHCRMVAEAARSGGHIEKVYYCPHSCEADCPCRKPRPGMLLRARDELALDMRHAVFIGDCITDVLAGIAAGVCPILVLTGLGNEQLRLHCNKVTHPFLVRVDLCDAVDAVLQGAYLTTWKQEEARFHPLLL